MKAKPSTLGREINPEPGLWKNFVINRRYPGGDLAIRARYAESRQKMKRYCSAMAPCPTGFTHTTRFHRSIASIAQPQESPDNLLGTLVPGTYILKYWTGWAWCDAWGPGGPYSINNMSQSGFLFYMDGPGISPAQLELDQSYRRFSTKTEMLDAFRANANKPSRQFNVIPQAPLLKCWWTANQPPIQVAGFLDLALCRANS